MWSGFGKKKDNCGFDALLFQFLFRRFLGVQHALPTVDLDLNVQNKVHDGFR